MKMNAENITSSPRVEELMNHPAMEDHRGFLRLCSLENDLEVLEQLYEAYKKEHVQRIKKKHFEATQTELVLGDEVDPGLKLVLTSYERNQVINAQGLAVEDALKRILNGLAVLKNMQDADKWGIAAQMIVSGAIGIGTVYNSGALDKIIELGTSVAESIAAVAGVEVVTVTGASGLLMIVNDTDTLLTQTDLVLPHGKMTANSGDVLPSVVFPGAEEHNRTSYSLYAISKRENALIGTRMGISFTTEDGTSIQFAMEVPLTGIYGGNNCFCQINSSAEACADATHEPNQATCSVEGSGYNVSIKVASQSGSDAYYIAIVRRSASCNLALQEGN